MGRLKKEHSGYYSSGLWLKYQEPKIDEPQLKHKSKKNTAKWCRGKRGVEHKLRRYFWEYGWERKRTKWIRTRCIECDRQFYQNRPSVPLIVPIDKISETTPIQVKVNGVCLPISSDRYIQDRCYCEMCY